MGSLPVTAGRYREGAEATWHDAVVALPGHLGPASPTRLPGEKTMRREVRKAMAKPAGPNRGTK